MKIRNKYIYSKDQAMLVTLREEYISFGFDTSLESGVLVIFARKRKKDKKKKEDRNKRRERTDRS